MHLIGQHSALAGPPSRANQLKRPVVGNGHVVVLSARELSAGVDGHDRSRF